MASALEDIREKLVSAMEQSVARGWQTKVLTKRQTVIEVKDDLAIIAEEFMALSVDVPELRESRMMQIDLDYNL